MGQKNNGELSFIQRQLQLFTCSFADPVRKITIDLKPIFRAIKSADHLTLNNILTKYATDLTDAHIREIADFAASIQVPKMIAKVMEIHDVTNGRYGEMVDLMYSDGITHELKEDELAFLGDNCCKLDPYIDE